MQIEHQLYNDDFETFELYKSDLEYQLGHLKLQLNSIIHDVLIVIVYILVLIEHVYFFQHQVDILVLNNQKNNNNNNILINTYA